MDTKKLFVLKKNGTRESFSVEKILTAVGKSAERVMIVLSAQEKECLINEILEMIERKGVTVIPVADMHIFVENALRKISIPVADSYCRYRDHKKEYAELMSEAFTRANAIQYDAQAPEEKNGNANANNTLVSTKRCLIADEFNKMLYENFNLTKEELEAHRDKYIHIHDENARRDTINCCLFDLANVLKGGFYHSAKGGMWYNEPQSLDKFGDVVGDVIMMAASQQYGGFTVCEIDKIMEPYAEKTYQKIKQKTYQKVLAMLLRNGCEKERAEKEAEKEAEEEALSQVKEQMRDCFQGWEYKFNTVASSRGDYPFITFSYGLGTGRFAKLASITCSEVRGNGQGRTGVKKPVLFPKLVFLYDENLHGEGCELSDVFDAAVQCSLKSMYPDFLSLTGDGGYGSVSYMYKKYGVVTSPMGCRAFLSPWFERGGMYPADENDKPITVGRFNIGVVSLNLPMIYQKAKVEGRDFYEVLDYYLQLIRQLHIRTFAYLGQLKASSYPLGYMCGGFHGGNLKADDTIEPLLDSATASFGITALNELQVLHNGKRLTEDQTFANEVTDYITEKLQSFKNEDGRLYALYGTPAENLCGQQVKHFRRKYGIIPGVSDKLYVSNSFHCHVSEDITPTEKQDTEYQLFHKFTGGRIQYVRYPIDYNTEAVKALIKRAMKMGFYEGVNMAMCTCEECGYKELDMKICPRCKSLNISRIDRMNGYLQWTQTGNSDTVNSRKAISAENMAEIIASADTTATCDTRTSLHKLAEIRDRRSM